MNSGNKGRKISSGDIRAHFVGHMSSKSNQKMADQDMDYNNPSFLKAVVKIQAAYRGHKCRQQLDDQDMAEYGY